MLSKYFTERTNYRPPDKQAPYQPGARLEGFSSQEVARLEELRGCFAQRLLNEWPEECKRLRFARWLHRRGLLTR